jgi:hypothetical protein
VEVFSMRRICLFLGVLVALAPSSARAQGSTPGLGGLLLRFFSPSNPVVLKANPVPAFSHDAHFVTQPNAQASLKQINSQLAAQISTFPIGSSSGGFTFTFDSSLGVYNRTTQSFGPLFAERPQTAGKGKFSAGVNFQNATYDRIEGQDLRNGDLELFLVHIDTNNDHVSLEPWFEGDIIGSTLSIDLQAKTTVFFANYGFTSKFDVGVAIPYQDISIDARIDADIERLATSVDPFVVHTFPDDTSLHTYRESGSANGLGDVLVRAKYNFKSGSSLGMAAALDLRLPTGKSEDLLGSGATQAKAYLVLGGGGGRFSPRTNLGYTFSSGGSDFTGDLPDEINYTAGFDLVPHRRVTLAADFVGRTLLDADRLVYNTKTFNYRTRLDATIRQTTRPELTTEKGNLTIMLASVGLKINPVGRLLLVGNVLFSLGDGGLQDKVTPVFGLDYTF